MAASPGLGITRKTPSVDRILWSMGDFDEEKYSTSVEQSIPKTDLVTLLQPELVPHVNLDEVAICIVLQRCLHLIRCSFRIWPSGGRISNDTEFTVCLLKYPRPVFTGSK
jgi:hypothetical protein